MAKKFKFKIREKKLKSKKIPVIGSKSSLEARRAQRAHHVEQLRQQELRAVVDNITAIMMIELEEAVVHIRSSLLEILKKQ